MGRRRRSAALAAVLVALPRIAVACPVCMAADARRMNAYVVTTVFLSLVPLGVIGGIGWLVWKRSGLRDGAVPDGAAPRPER